MRTPRLPILLPLVGLALAPEYLAAQAALDPSVAPRAAALAGAGQRARATEMLGHYLATAPDDGGAWLELGRFYLLDGREWHREGHEAESPGPLFLDFAATALDQSLRLPTDSSRFLRALVEVERAAMLAEAEGWLAVQAAPARAMAPPPFVAELGRNLVNSCPMGGVLVTGSDLEAVGVWAVTLSDNGRGDLILLLPARYREDSAYRARMAAALEVQPVPTVAEALTLVAVRRPVCLTPALADSDLPAAPLAVLRLLRVAGPPAPEPALPLSVIELAAVTLSRPGALSREAVAHYQLAARYNPLLCVSLLAPLGTRPRDACGR